MKKTLNLKLNLLVKKALLFSLLFALFSILIFLLEKNITFTRTAILVSSHDYANDIYIIIIGSLMTLLTIATSLMMVVLTIYGAEFSPRTLQDFLSNKKTLNILGYLIGVLLFSIINFILLDSFDKADYLISPNISTILFISSIFVFLSFIWHVSRSVQINIYVQTLGKDIKSEIEKKKINILEDNNIHFKKDIQLPSNYTDNLHEIQSEKNGYMQGYNFSKILELAIDNDLIIIFEKQIGEFIFTSDVLCSIVSNIEVSETLKTEIISLVIINEETSFVNNLGFGTQKLSEIALRALPPTKSDFATASFCIEQLGESLKEITTILAHVVYTDSSGKTRLIAQKENFSRVLYDHFSLIKTYGFNNISIIKSTLTALIKISESALERQNDDSWEFTMYMLEHVDFKKLNSLDYEYLILDLYQIATLTDHITDFERIFKK